MTGRLYQIFTMISLVVQELTRWPCRECNHRVSLLEDVCAECGTYGPLRLPCSFLIHSAFLSATAILAIRITRMLTS